MLVTVEGTDGMLPSPTPGDDEVRAALEKALSILEQAEQRTLEMRAKGVALIGLRNAGRPWEEILLDEHPPPMTVLLAESAHAIGEASSLMRRAEVRVLHRSGCSMARIAHRLGVSRQRVSSMLKLGEVRQAQNGAPERAAEKGSG